MIAPAELRVGFQPERFERRPHLQIGIAVQAIANEAAIDGTFTVVLEPVADITVEVLVSRLHIDTEGVEQKPAIVFGGIPMLIAIVGAQGAADVQAALAVLATPGDMRKRLFRGGR
ncbi:hypothetical protein D3C72_1823540 [compost metagenome]